MAPYSHREMKVYGDIKLFAGTGSPELAQKISDYLKSPLCGRDVIEFPNENLFVKLHSSVRGQDVYVIQQTATNVHRNLMELLIMIQTLRLDSAARITAVVLGSQAVEITAGDHQPIAAAQIDKGTNVFDAADDAFQDHAGEGLL